MSFSPAPTGWFSGVSVTASGLTIPFSALNNLDQTKADPNTGDIRELVYNFCEAFADAWATKPAEDRPSQLVINTSTSVSTSGAEEILTKIYTIRVSLSVENVDIVGE